MITGFWKKLKKPFLSLAPMADVTDCVFRALIAKYSGHGKASGGLMCFWTEFVSADGLCNEMGRKHLLIDLKYSEAERLIVAQLLEVIRKYGKLRHWWRVSALMVLILIWVVPTRRLKSRERERR